MRAVALAALLVLPALPVVSAAPPSVVLDAGAPDGWRVPLTAAVAADGRVEVQVALDLRWSSPDGEAAWTERWPDAVVDGNATLSGEFVAEHGAGRYEAVLRVGDGASAPVVVAFDAPAPATASTTVTWDGVSSTAALSLTSDSVNADGKLKLPGEEVVTRLVAEDAGGLQGDLRVEVRAEDGRRVAADRVRLPAGTKASLEHRFALSPLAVGNYTLTVASDASSVRRTFTIKDASAVIVRAEAAPQARAGRTFEAVFTVGDRNLDAAGRAAGALVAKLYRGTTAVLWPVASGGAVGDGVVAIDLSGATSRDPTWEVQEGLGTVERVVSVDVPADAKVASYRVAVMRGGDKLGEAAFDVVPPPSVALRATTARPGSVLALAGTAVGVDQVKILVSGPVVAQVDAPVVAGAFAANVSLPRGIAAGTPVRVRALADDAEATLETAVENAPPETALDVRHAGLLRPARVLPGSRLEVAAAADDPNGGATEVRVRLVDVDGREVAQAQGGVLRIPDALPRGAYAVEAVARDADGAVGLARHPVAVGAWVEAGFVGGEVRARRAGDALEATATVANTGNVAVREAVLVVGELAGAAPVDATLALADGTTVTGAVEGGRVRFDVQWPPGEARLHVRWGRPADEPADRSAPLVLVVRGDDA